MNILITGVSGFIGKKIVEVVHRPGRALAGIDKCEPGDDAKKHCNFKRCDLSDASQVQDICRGQEIVVHLAGESEVYASDKNHQSNNFESSKNLFISAITHKVKQVIYLSTSKHARNEMYARTKREAENLLISLCEGTDTKYTIIRSPIVYGMGMKSGISRWMALYRNRVIPDVRESAAELDMIGVEDLCTAINLCIDNKKVMNQVFLVSDGHKYKIREVDRVIRSVLGRGKKYLSVPKICLYLAAKAGDWFSLAGVNVPINSARYNMLFNSQVAPDESFQKMTGFKPTGNFLSEIPMIFNNK